LTGAARRCGLAPGGARAYLALMRLSFLGAISPLRAIRDLRRFLASRQRHEVWIMFGSLIITWATIAGIIQSSRYEKEYHENIVYVQQWPANRTDAQIIAQQKIDGPKEQAAKDAEAKREADERAAYKRLDDKLKRWGF